MEAHNPGMDTTVGLMNQTEDTPSDNQVTPPVASGFIRPIPVTPGDRLVLTVTEAGQLLGISRAFAYELAARGDLPVIRLGRRVVVPKAALLKMVGLGSPAS